MGIGLGAWGIEQKARITTKSTKNTKEYFRF
jgi:hypothetical protein